LLPIVRGGSIDTGGSSSVKTAFSEFAALPLQSCCFTYDDNAAGFTHYSGFAGLGSFALAWSPLNCTCVGGFEWDDAARAAFHQSFPDIHLGGDIGQLDWQVQPWAHCYNGGAPCQTYSKAGRREGASGRGLLMFD